MNAVRKILGGIDTGIDFLTKIVLFIVVMSMLFLSVTSIFLRWFETSYGWMEPLIRHLVFLSAFLGGVLATGRGTHIGIDILGKYLEGMQAILPMRVLKAIICFVSSGTLIWLIFATWEFMKIELEFGRPVFFGISSGVLVGIIPLGFGLIAYRFFYHFFVTVFFGLPKEDEVKP